MRDIPSFARGFASGFMDRIVRIRRAGSTLPLGGSR